MTKDTRERFTFRLPTELSDKIKLHAKAKGWSVNALILQILWEWEKKQK